MLDRLNDSGTFSLQMLYPICNILGSLKRKVISLISVSNIFKADLGIFFFSKVPLLEKQ